MSFFRRVTVTLGLVGTGLVATPAVAQDREDTPRPPAAAPVQTPPYSADVTQEDNPPTVPRPVNVNVQPAPAPPTTVIAPPAQVVTPPPPVVVEERPVNVSVFSPRHEIGMAVSLGGGVGEFTDSSLRDRTGVNGEYEARIQIGTRSPIALEAAYVGTAGSIDALGLDDNAILLSNGIEGLARLNLGTRQIQPFIVGGASWVRYSIVNSNVNTSDVRDRDDVLAIPVGAGLATYVGDTGFMADVRFMYRFTFNDDLIRPTSGNSDGSSLANWNVSLRLGYAF